jgi:hypothetical protein
MRLKEISVTHWIAAGKYLVYLYSGASAQATKDAL